MIKYIHLSYPNFCKLVETTNSEYLLLCIRLIIAQGGTANFNIIGGHNVIGDRTAVNYVHSGK